jgi:hypothetical protein
MQSSKRTQVNTCKRNVSIRQDHATISHAAIPQLQRHRQLPRLPRQLQQRYGFLLTACASAGELSEQHKRLQGERRWPDYVSDIQHEG